MLENQNKSENNEDPTLNNLLGEIDINEELKAIEATMDVPKTTDNLNTVSTPNSSTDSTDSADSTDNDDDVMEIINTYKKKYENPIEIPTLDTDKTQPFTKTPPPSNVTPSPVTPPNVINPEIKITKKPNEPESFNVSFDKDVYQVKDFKVKKPKKKKYFSGVFKLFRILIIVLVAVILSYGALFSIGEVMGTTRDGQDVIFEVSKGDSVYDIAYKLKEKAIIRSELLFRTYIKVLRMDPSLQYGVHKINTSMAYGEIIYELEKHTVSAETVKVTFPEGFTLLKIANRLEANEVCPADEFLEAFNTTDFDFDFEGEISDNKLKYFKKEGFAFPDTYKFEKGENPYNVANKIAKNFESKITPEMYARMNKLGLSLEDTIIVASIVQSEAGESDEMKKVASVYFNRLKNKDVYPNLQADPTRKYVREIKAEMDIANQEILSAYNTYEGAGLPPGAIANPGIDAIMATLYPDDTPYFYFCTNLDTKRFYYAETLKEHEDNLFRAGLV